MAVFLVRRLFLMVPVLIVITVLVFVFLQVTGVDPVSVVLGQDYTPQQAEVVRRQLGLDRPLVVQYVIWLSRAAQGDLGRSYIQRARVSELLLDRLPNTISLAATAMIFSLAIAIPAGMISATKRRSWIDAIVRIVAIIDVSVPVFWLGILLIVLFALRVPILPPGGSIELYGFRALILPSIALGASLAGITTRLTRSSVLDILSLDYVKTARSKGLSERRVLYKHALKNALLPIVTMIGLQFGAVLGGAVLTETVFSIPGLGRLLIDSIHNRDYPVVQGCILLITIFFLVVNLVVDLLYAFLNPRVRYS